jgi:hypothetical protein
LAGDFFDMSNRSVTADEAEQIANAVKLDANPDLMTLMLSSNQIGDRGAMAIATCMLASRPPTTVCSNCLGNF